MNGACSTHGRKEKCIQRFGRNILRKETIWNSMNLWENNIKMNLKETEWESVDWICLVQGTNKHGTY
jgi:hypothetical protein